MDSILEAIMEINSANEMDLDESTASFPSEDLPLDIWDKDENGEYRLKSELKEMILNALSQYPGADLLDLAKGIKIVGSIGTNLYDEDADIDVHIEPKSEFLEGKSEDELAEFQRDVMNWFKNERDAKNWYVLKHPLEVYVQLNPIQDYFSDTVYDLMSDEWIKVPKKYDLSYNPYTEYGDIFTELDEVVASTDALVGKLHRTAKDVQLLSDKGHDEVLNERLENIRQFILILKEYKEQWRLIRRRNSAVIPDEIPEDPEILQHSAEWKRDNTLFKFLDRYGYFGLVNDLAKLLDDNDQLLPDFLSSLSKILSDFYTV